jgi:hypothetical protein
MQVIDFDEIVPQVETFHNLTSNTHIQETTMTHTQSTREADRTRAVELIRDLAAQGHMSTFIAKALNLQSIPTPSGRPGARWDHSAVIRIARRYMIAVGYGHRSHAGAAGCLP